jgi:hypothetical protein
MLNVQIQPQIQQLRAAAVCIFLSFSLFGCASGPAKKAVPVYSGPFYSGDGGSGIHLAVLQPEGIDLTENEQWALVFIQNTLSGDFSKYSAMKVTGREERAAQTDNAAGKTNATHILAGRLRKISNAEYLFQLTITDAGTGVQKASYSKQILALHLRDSLAIQDAAQDLLVQMGVELTDAGRESLQQPDPDEREGAVALAKGLTAERSGNAIESLSYMYNAVSYDSALTEAASHAETLSANLFSGGLGDQIQNDINARNFWKKLIDEFESFYTQHPPFEIVFTPSPNQKGITDYEAAGGATADIKIDVYFRESPDLNGMRKVLNLIMTGLEKTRKKDDWGFTDWPYSTKLFGGFRKFVFKTELINDNNAVLKTASFSLSGRMLAFRKNILPDSYPKQEIIFSSIKVDSLTSNPMVRIVSVDDIDVGQSGNDGYIRIVPVEKLPPASSRNLLVYVTRDYFNIR